MKRQTTLRIIGALIAFLVISLVVFLVIKVTSRPEEDKPAEIVELDSIPKYGYVLEDRDTPLYKDTFDQLREVLTNEEVNFDEYAKLLAELYIIDLYTIDNKMNQYDVGGIDFVLEKAKENYELKVKDTLYKYIEDDTYGKRSQKLPKVSSISSSEIEKTTVKLENKNYEGYKVPVTWEYVEDMDYDTSATITLIKIDEKLYITNQSASD
mgnify:CR=1 FL=1